MLTTLLMTCEEPSVTVSALTCTATALNTRSPYSEVAAALTQTHSSSTATSAATLITELKALLTERTQLNIRIEILQIFAALVNNYFKEFKCVTFDVSSVTSTDSSSQ